MAQIKVAIIAATTGVVEFLAATSFNNTVTTGAIISTLAVVMVAGFFTIRANTAKIWRENYEGQLQRANALESENTKLREQILRERDEQQKIRHDLKNDLATALLKTDLTVHEAQEAARHEEMVQVLKGIQVRHDETVGVLSEMKSAMAEMTKSLIKNGGSK